MSDPEYPEHPQLPEQYQAVPPQQYQQHPVQPGYPQPGAFPPSKRGLSGGAWAGIISGIVLLVAGLTAALVFLVILPGQQSAPPSSSAGTGNSSTSPQSPGPQMKPTPPKNNDPGAKSGLDGGTLDLDREANFAMGPFWAVSMADGWQIDSFDVAGEHVLSHRGSDCQFYSYQGFGGFATSSDGDLAASERTLEGAIRSGKGLPWEWGPGSSPSVVFDARVQVRGQSAGGLGTYEEVEMLRYIADYTATDGIERTRVFVIRNFQPDDATLLAMTDCPAKTGKTGLDYLQKLQVNDAY